MCLAVYLASEFPLAALPWRDEEPGFHVESSPAERPAALSGSYMAYLGAHTGCSCGFRASDDHTDAADGQRSLTAFCAFLAGALRRGPVSVFVGWEGDQLEPTVETQTLTVEEAVQCETWRELFERGSTEPMVVRIENSGPT